MAKVKKRITVQTTKTITHAWSVVVEMDEWFAKDPDMMDALGDNMIEHATDAGLMDEAKVSWMDDDVIVDEAEAGHIALYHADNDIEGISFYPAQPKRRPPPNVT